MAWTRRQFLHTSLAAGAAAGLPDLGAGEAAIQATTPQPSPRQRLLMDLGWRFHLGHAADPAKDFGFGSAAGEATFAKSGESAPAAELQFDDSAWRAVDLPHDWAVELPFVNVPPDIVQHGARPLGREYPETSVGWYRRVFAVPASDVGRRLTVEFDGVFRDAIVFLNGHYLGRNFSGYAPFSFDITDLATYGAQNVLTVRADATLAEGWFYEGAGIYRHVWLTRTSPLHIAQWGTFVKAQVRGARAALEIATEVENHTNRAAAVRVTSRIFAPAGALAAQAASEPFAVPAWGRHTFRALAAVANPALWSLETPQLYRAECTVESEGRSHDREDVTFGIRSIRFDAERLPFCIRTAKFTADKGFFLNGNPFKIQGTCNHQDHAGVGAALPDRLQAYRIERLKAMASNGYRTSHNPPTPELLDACDRLGMLVMDETRMMSSTPEGLSQLQRMVRRDRNHPSIVLWSLGNEEPEQGTDRGARMVADMKRLVNELDGTRPVTVAMNRSWGQGVSAVVDVQGFNYGNHGDLGAQMDQFHRDFPHQPTIGSETASEQMTRGIYTTDPARGYVSAYDVNFPSYTVSAEHWWKVYAERRFLSGAFAWTGFDYRGEPSPYGWPCVSSHFGAMDTCGFPKDTFFYYQAAWGSEPVLHLFPHWNWAGREGRAIDVWCYSNLEEVELLVNGRSLGTQAMPRNGHLSWSVPFAPGFIEARGKRGGKVVRSAKRETTGVPARVVLRPDRASLAADGADVSVVTVEIVDAEGRVVPDAFNEVRFTLEGPARLLGVGNGDPSSHEPDKSDRRSAFNGLCCALVQAGKQPGEVRVTGSSDGLQAGSATISLQLAAPPPVVA